MKIISDNDLRKFKFIRKIINNNIEYKLFRDIKNKESLIMKEYIKMDKDIDLKLFLENLKKVFEVDWFILKPIYYLISDDKIKFIYKYIDFNLDSFIKSLINNQKLIKYDVLISLYNNFYQFILNLHENNLTLKYINFIDIKIIKNKDVLEFYYDYFYSNLLYDINFNNKTCYSWNKLNNFKKIKFFDNFLKEDFEVLELFILRISMIFKNFYVIDKNKIIIEQDFFKLEIPFLKNKFEFTTINLINDSDIKLDKTFIKNLYIKNNNLNQLSFEIKNNFIIVNNKIYNFNKFCRNINDNSIIKNKYDLLLSFIKNYCNNFNISFNKFNPWREELFLKEFNNEFYFGILKLNKFENIGFYYYSNDEIYLGQFKNNFKHGYGIYLYKNNDVYQGYWSNNLRDGNGLYIYENKSYYLGSWSNNLKHGNSIYFISKSNLSIECIFQKDQFFKFFKQSKNNLDINTTYNLQVFYEDLSLLKQFVPLFKENSNENNPEEKTQRKLILKEKIIYKINNITEKIKIEN